MTSQQIDNVVAPLKVNTNSVKHPRFGMFSFAIIVSDEIWGISGRT